MSGTSETRDAPPAREPRWLQRRFDREKRIGQILAAIQHRCIPNDYSAAWSKTTKRDEIVAEIRDRSMCRPLIVGRW